MMTVKQFLETGKHNGVHITAPDGFVELNSEQVKDLLAGKEVQAHPGVIAHSVTVDSEDILGQVILNEIITLEDGSVAFMTDYKERA